MTAKEIRKELSSVRKEMKERGIRKISCFNGGLTPYEYLANSKLYMLKVQLEQAIAAESKTVVSST